MDYFSEPSLTPTLANKRQRYFAAIIDYVLYAMLLYVILYFFGNKEIDADNNISYELNGLASLPLWALWFVLIPITEGLTGQTVGKMLFKIEVLKINHSKTNIGSSIVRHLFDFVDYLPFIGIVGLLVAGNNSNKQRVGDLVANTVVVNKENKIA